MFKGIRLRPRPRGLHGLLCAIALAAMVWPGTAWAHVSEQALVLLLPTGHYITGGVLSVAASIILISLTPKRAVLSMYTPVDLPLPAPYPALRHAISVCSFLALSAFVILGTIGPRDPLANILPPMIWTGWWIVMFSVIGLAGNLWLYLNPWTGPYRLVFGRFPEPLVRLPDWLGVWPGVCVFLAFSAFYTIDPAPTDPDRLALVVACYWLLTFAGMAVFGGADWIKRGEAFSILFSLVARVSPLGDWSRPAVGFAGWDLAPAVPLAAGLGFFSLAVLGVGSFDGLKETFWWLDQIGVNPLEFPGRTAVMGSSALGLALAVAALTGVFSSAVWMGGRIARLGSPGAEQVPFARLFCSFAPTVLPIALGYHMSHFYIAFLVDGQYLLAAIGDPLATGANFLGLADIHITTGFLNTPDSVRAIWLTQLVFVVAGHVLSVLASHRVAMGVFGDPRRAALSQIPLGLFMVLYTLFGLWLLAAPRGA